MFGCVGKLISRAIFSACHFFKLGPKKNLRQPKEIVPNKWNEISWDRIERVKGEVRPL